MIHSALALQKAIQVRLLATAGLTNLIGMGGVFDDVPENRKFPYVSYGEATHTAWTTGTEDGTEHTIEINVWSQRRGRRQVLLVSSEIETALHEFDVELDQHHLVNFAHVSTKVTHDEKTEIFRGQLTFRAVTEPLPIGQ